MTRVSVRDAYGNTATGSVLSVTGTERMWNSCPAADPNEVFITAVDNSGNAVTFRLPVRPIAG
jgi:hypothetical protein